MDCPIVRFEICCRGKARTEASFRNMLGWAMTAAAEASMIDTGAGSGINGHISSLGHEPHHHAAFYVQVNDIPAYLTVAESLGGKTLVPPVTIPLGTFAWFADLDGTTVGPWTAK